MWWFWPVQGLWAAGIVPADICRRVRDERFANSGECELDVSEKYGNIREVNGSENEERLL